MAYADYISTHSLTKRLTVLQHFTRLGLYISTHSLTKRLTRDGEYYVPDWAVFQLTASRRGWQGIERWTCDCNSISTHSLTKRLTELLMYGVCVWFHFNSQPHEEADATFWNRRFAWMYFNSQPHEEADGIAPIRDIKPASFQLTASRRGWRYCRLQRQLWPADISTHSLTKRLTGGKRLSA